MAYVWADRVLETSTTTGTGALVLAGAVSKYRTFASVCSVADTLPYVIVNLDANEWEVGLGTYSAANQLTRTTVQASSNAGAAVNFSAGTKRVGLATTAGSLVPSTGGTMTGQLTVSDGLNVTHEIQTNGVIRSTKSVDSSSTSEWIIRHSRGTIGAQSALLQNDRLFDFYGQGFGASGFINGFRMLSTTVAATPSNTDMESRTQVFLCPSSSVTLTEIYRFDHATGMSMFGANPVIDANRLHRLRQYTVATLPTVGTAGRLAAVTDATAPTYNGALTGGGAVNVPVYDNGAAWVSH